MIGGRVGVGRGGRGVGVLDRMGRRWRIRGMRKSVRNGAWDT